MTIHKIFGPPGTGKTTKLLAIMEDCLSRGIPPERIAFVSFTRKAVQEGKNRALKHFSFESAQLCHFKTLHAMCYSDQSYGNGDIMDNDHYQELAYKLGLELSSMHPELHLPTGTLLGDKVMMLDSLARLRCESIEETYRKCRFNDLLPKQIQYWRDGLAAYKKKHGIWDYTDLLENFDNELDVDVFILDEAQDLSKLQWRVFGKARNKAPEIYMAGDDDQSIYTWAGADPELFIKAKGEPEVLPQSWRIPRQIQVRAERIIAQVKVRQPKEWAPRDEEGVYESVRELGALDLLKGSWMLLARSNAHLKRYHGYCKEKGLLYWDGDKSSFREQDALAIRAWEDLRKGRAIDKRAGKAVAKLLPAGATEDVYRLTLMEQLNLPNAIKELPWYDVLGMHPSTREYYRTLLSRGIKPEDEPKIRITTIHKAKGGEADNVAIITDCFKSTYLNQSADEEYRTKYVAITRARKGVYLIQNRGRKEYVLS